MLFGEFKHQSLSKPIGTVSKSRLQEIVEVLKKLLLSDWNDVNFVIGSKRSRLTYQRTRTTSLR